MQIFQLSKIFQRREFKKIRKSVFLKTRNGGASESNRNQFGTVVRDFDPILFGLGGTVRVRIFGCYGIEIH